MNDHFRIRLAVEMITLSDQFLPQLNIVLDDAVVNDRELSVVG